MQVYYVSFGNEGENFPLLMAIIMPASCLCAMFIIRPMPEVRNGDQKTRLDVFSAILFVLAVYLLAVILIQNYIDVGRPWRAVILGGIVLILLSPLWVVFKTGSDGDDNETKESLLSPTETSTLEEKVVRLDEASKIANETSMARNIGLLEAMVSLDFWLLFFTSACGMGSGLTTINNMSQLGSSLGYSSQEITTFVSLWSIWNFSGRLGGGYISELFLHSNKVPRPVFIMITLGIMAIGHAIIALAFPGALYVGPILIGTCYGAQWSLMPATASEIFGLMSFGSIFNTIAVASPLSSYILSIKVTGYLYDLEAESGSCTGARCFRLSFIVMAATCVAGACVSVVLSIRTSRFYKSIRH